MPRWPQEIAEAVLFDIRFGLKFRVGARSRPATDQKIDQLVYELYGLTDKEIALVEQGR